MVLLSATQKKWTRMARFGSRNFSTRAMGFRERWPRSTAASRSLWRSPAPPAAAVRHPAGPAAGEARGVMESTLWTPGGELGAEVVGSSRDSRPTIPWSAGPSSSRPRSSSRDRSLPSEVEGRHEWQVKDLDPFPRHIDSARTTVRCHHEIFRMRHRDLAAIGQVQPKRPERSGSMRTAKLVDVHDGSLPGWFPLVKMGY